MLSQHLVKHYSATSLIPKQMIMNLHTLQNIERIQCI